jgi:hypothetical protein
MKICQDWEKVSKKTVIGHEHSWWPHLRIAGIGRWLHIIWGILSYWAITPCSLLKVNLFLGGTCHFHHRDWRVNKARNQRELLTDHIIISQKIEPFVTTTVRTSCPVQVQAATSAIFYELENSDKCCYFVFVKSGFQICVWRLYSEVFHGSPKCPQATIWVIP